MGHTLLFALPAKCYFPLLWICSRLLASLQPLPDPFLVDFLLGDISSMTLEEKETDSSSQ
jgi:hypothetical protein